MVVLCCCSVGRNNLSSVKKAVVASILGIVATLAAANRARAQGYVIFANYSGDGATAPITYTGLPYYDGFVGGETIGTGFTANLIYSFGANFGSTYTDSGITTGFLMPSGTPVEQGGGLFGFLSNTVTIPGYTSGPCDFIVEVYNGSSYFSADSTLSTRSSVVTLSTLATSANLLPIGSLMPDNLNVTVPLTAFTMAAIPEPSTFALAGVGGAALLMFRPKK